jgi:hypothetical protein
MQKLTIRCHREKLEELIGLLRSVYDGKEPPECVSTVEVYFDALPAFGADGVFIRLEPTKRLLDLVAAGPATELKRSVS